MFTWRKWIAPIRVQLVVIIPELRIVTNSVKHNLPPSPLLMVSELSKLAATPFCAIQYSCRRWWREATILNRGVLIASLPPTKVSREEGASTVNRVRSQQTGFYKSPAVTGQARRENDITRSYWLPFPSIPNEQVSLPRKAHPSITDDIHTPINTVCLATGFDLRFQFFRNNRTVE